MRAPRGFTILETVVASMLLVVAMTVSIQFLGWMALQQREANRRLWATAEIGNLMERITAMPYDRVSQHVLDQLQLSESTRTLLPDATLTATLLPQANPAGKRLHLELRWRDRSGQLAGPVRLTTWVFQRQEKGS